jgi:hypothetical protein
MVTGKRTCYEYADHVACSKDRYYVAPLLLHEDVNQMLSRKEDLVPIYETSVTQMTQTKSDLAVKSAVDFLFGTRRGVLLGDRARLARDSRQTLPPATFVWLVRSH